MENINTIKKAYVFGWLSSYRSIPFYSNSCILSYEEEIDFLSQKEHFILDAFPTLETDELTWAFVRGYFEGNGCINEYQEGSIPECCIVSPNVEILKSIGQFSQIPYKIIKNDTICFQGTNCIDFLGKVYANRDIYYFKEMYDAYIEWCMLSKNTELPECLVYKTDINAVIPSKTKASDAGYDLTIIKKHKQLWNNMVLYDTGIKIRPVHGLYTEIVPRSSLIKTGYMLANSIGIIDANYNGNLLIALVKVVPEAPEIELPLRCCQLIFRKQIHVEMTEVIEAFDSTSREEGGFGSTGR